MDTPYNIPSRKNIRAEFHDYSGGEYFVTLCTYDKIHYFGEIRNGNMDLNDIGEYCRNQLESLQEHYPYCDVPLYVIMPNHIHAIICIDSRLDRPNEHIIPKIRSALSVIIGGFKRSVTMFAHRNNIEFRWQGRYHDHIIRGIKDRNNIADYIENNVARWADDCYNPPPLI